MCRCRQRSGGCRGCDRMATRRRATSGDHVVWSQFCVSYLCTFRLASLELLVICSLFQIVQCSGAHDNNMNVFVPHPYRWHHCSRRSVLRYVSAEHWVVMLGNLAHIVTAFTLALSMLHTLAALPLLLAYSFAHYFFTELVEMLA